MIFKRKNGNNNTATLVLFSLTLFLSAALMFGLQPMVGKMLLPIVGGTPSGWIVAMAFFQVMLLAGYFLAHALSRFEPHTQGLLYIGCLGAGIFFLPVILDDHTHLLSPTPMAFDVFLLLSVVVAVPFIALSATASTIQRLFMTTGHASAKDPYFLYAASNLGSFAGLLLYPFLIEPLSTLTAQSRGWLAGYALLMSLAAGCLALARKKKAQPVQKALAKRTAPVAWKKRLEWVALAFLPSSLLLGVTTYITTDIFSVPLLWVLPLSIYLLTYVIAFSKKPIVNYSWILKMQPVAVAATLVVTLLITGNFSHSIYACLINLVTFTVIALMCHMRLAQARPIDNPHHLTEFYLMIAIGGALGGVLNAFVAPLLFSRLQEYPLMIIASGLLNQNIRKKFTKFHAYCLFAACILVTGFSIAYAQEWTTQLSLNIFLVIILAMITFHPKMSVASGLALILSMYSYYFLHPSILSQRNFYGVIKVYDRHVPVTTKTEADVRYMMHGTTLHGYQILDKKYETTPTTYYTREGPLNDAINTFKPKAIAAIGLGTGTINCYATPKRKITFIEIDPAVVKMAKEKFTYLSKCGTGGIPPIIVGDARLELKKLKDKKFDMIVLDAFSSDMVPTHLLTKEAIEVYLDRLAPRGIILFHISNRYFKLDGPIAAAGKTLGLRNAVVTRQHLPQLYAAASRWMILTRKNVNLLPLAGKGWMHSKLVMEIKPWTDDYTNLLSALNLE